MCSIICTISLSWLRAASPTKGSMRARLAGEAHKPVAKCKVPIFMGDGKHRKETNTAFDSGHSTSCATEINKHSVAKVSPVSQGLVMEPWNMARGCSYLDNTELWASEEALSCLSQNILLLVEANSKEGSTSVTQSSLDLSWPSSLIHSLQACRSFLFRRLSQGCEWPCPPLSSSWTKTGWCRWPW